MKLTIIKKIIKSLFFVFLLSLCFSIVLSLFDYTHWNGIDEKEDENMITKILNRLYFVTTTMSSVGYGDISPKSHITKILVIMMQMFVVIGFIAIYQSKIIGL